MNVKKSELVTEDFSIELESNADQTVIHLVLREFKNVTDAVGEVVTVEEKNAIGVVLLVEELLEIQSVISDALAHQYRAEKKYEVI